jgi:hypothetical protein
MPATPNPAPVTGSGYRYQFGVTAGLGMEWLDLEDVNKDLESFTYAELDPAFPSVRIGLYGMRGQAILDAAVQRYSSVGTIPSRRTRRTGDGFLWEVSAGYGIPVADNVHMYPIIGFGLGRSALTVKDTDGERDPYRITTESVFFAPAISVRSFIPVAHSGRWDYGPVFDLRIGYRFSIEKKNLEETVPDTYLPYGGFFLHGVIGIGTGRY